MASQLFNKFKEPRYALIQVELLYMDHVNGGSPMSLQFSLAFAEKYLATLTQEPPMSFSNLYLKLLVAKKDFEKAEAYLNKYKATFQLWVEHEQWMLKVLHGRGDT